MDDTTFELRHAGRTTLRASQPSTSSDPYGSPPDLNGNGALGLDVRGQPWYGDVFGRYGDGQYLSWLRRVVLGHRTSDKLDDPYELDLSWSGAARRTDRRLPVRSISSVDHPFSPGDLERLLRFNDVDASSLSSRLLQVAEETFKKGAGNNPIDAAYRRSLVTTEGWDVPVPSTVMLPDLLVREYSAITTPDIQTTSDLELGSVGSETSLSFVELVRRRLSAEGFNLTNRINEQKALRQLVSWDSGQGRAPGSQPPIWKWN